METVRQVWVAVRVRGIEGDGPQEGIGIGTPRNLDAAEVVSGRVGPAGKELALTATRVSQPLPEIG